MLPKQLPADTASGQRQAFCVSRSNPGDDRVAQARGQDICAEIWRDAQQGAIYPSLNRYRLLVDGHDVHLLDGLAQLSEEKK